MSLYIKVISEITKVTKKATLTKIVNEFIKCDNVNLKLIDDVYYLEIKLPIKYLGYFSSNKKIDGLYIDNWFKRKLLINVDTDFIPEYSIVNNELLLKLIAWIN